MGREFIASVLCHLKRRYNMVKYTKDDMRTLQKMSVPGSPSEVYLPKLDFSPSAFKKLLNSYHLKKDISFLFELPLNRVGLLINKGEVSGYLKFRLQVGK